MGEVLNYFAELSRAMSLLGARSETLFVGQGVGCAGTAMTDTLADVPPVKLLEFPVAEELQMGFCTGLALQGILPICIFPRWNFLLLAANQLVNHLDRLPIYSAGGYQPKVIIRVSVPSTKGFNPGPQHDADFTDTFRWMLRTVQVVSLYKPELVVSCYERAMSAAHSTLLVEYSALYNVVPSGVKQGIMA